MRVFLSLVLGFSLAVYANGDVIVYDNGAGGAGGINSAGGSDSDFPEWLADDVTLGSTITVTGVEWTGVYGFDNTPPATDDFTIAFFLGDVNGGPSGAPVAEFDVGNQVNRSDSGFDIGDEFDIYEYSADINFTMNAGTTYWISIFGNTVGENDNFFWGDVNVGGNSFFSNDFAIWQPDFDIQDFRLTVVPEPSSTAFLGICLIGSWMRRRR